MCIAIVCFAGCDFINSEINLIFLIKLFFHLIEKSRQKFKWLENENILSWNKNHFSSFLKGFQLPQIVSDHRVRLWFVKYSLAYYALTVAQYFHLECYCLVSGLALKITKLDSEVALQRCS